MQTIIKIERRTEVTPSGATRIISRKVVIKPTDSNYPEELKKQQEYFEQNKRMVIDVNQRPR